MRGTVHNHFWACLALLLLAGGAGAATDCVDYTDMPHVLAELDGGDITDSSLSADGQTAFLASSYAGLWTVDLSDPVAPVTLATVGAAGSPFGVAAAGNLVALAVRSAGVQIFDCADPAAPAALATLGLPGECFSVAMEGDLVYATDYYNLHVIDIGDPSAPVLLASLPMACGPGRLQVVGDLAYVAAAYEGLNIVDISTPAVPVLLSSLTDISGVTDVQVTGNHAFLSHGGDGLYVVDVSDPAAPFVAGGLDLIDIGNSASCLVEHFDFVYLGTDEGLQVIDVLDKNTPTLVNKVGGLDINTASFHGDRIIAGLSHLGLAVIDAQHPDLSSHTATHVTPGFNANAMIIRDQVGYVCYGGSGVQVLDLSDPDHPLEMADLETPNSATEMVFYGADMAVVTDLSDAMHVVDISDPYHPSILGSLGLEDIPRGLAVSETAQQAYVSMNWGGVKIVDISNPAAPVQLFETWDMWMPDQIVADYPLIYVCDGDHGFQVLDVSDTYNPERLGTVEAYGPGLAVDFAAQLAYVAGEGLMVVDISDPLNLDVVTEVMVPGYNIMDISLDGDMAYVASGAAGLHALDISDRRAPVLVGSGLTTDEGIGVAVGAGRVYLAANFGQLEIHKPHCSGASDVAQGLPSPGEDLRAFPNPFNPRTTVSFHLPRAGRVNLAVCDLRGRRVRTLVTGLLPAGPRTAIWDGRDEEGQAVSSGIYLATLTLDGVTVHATKLALIR